jgi:hypothetical protein
VRGYSGQRKHKDRSGGVKRQNLYRKLVHFGFSILFEGKEYEAALTN